MMCVCVYVCVRAIYMCMCVLVAAIMKENDELQMQAQELKDKEQSLSALIANERREAARERETLQQQSKGEA